MVHRPLINKPEINSKFCAVSQAIGDLHWAVQWHAQDVFGDPPKFHAAAVNIPNCILRF